jgi:energy-coupling factor transport system permease protein
MFFLHPVLLAVSLAGGFACFTRLNRGKAARYLLRFLVPVILAMSIVNPFLNHAGKTILLYVNDNPFTLEACLYGIAAAAMFAGVLTWFSCFNAVMTPDKIIYLFGKPLPSLSLVFSMIMRFVPRFREQAKAIREAQRGIGGAEQNGFTARLKSGIKVFSILTTWALENGIITADSMKARGYGLSGRTSFRIYSVTKRDKSILIILFVLISTLLFGFLKGETGIRYFPSIEVKPLTGFSILIYLSYFLLCIFPILVNSVFEVIYHDRF